MTTAEAWTQGYDAGYNKAKWRFINAIVNVASDEILNAVLCEVGKPTTEDKADGDKVG